MKAFLILMLLLAGNSNVFAMDTTDQLRDFSTLCKYVNAKNGQPFNAQDYTEFDNYLTDASTSSLYMNASVLWNLTDSYAVEKSITAFQSIVEGLYSVHTFPAAAKIAQVRPAEIDSLAQTVAKKLAEQSLKSKKPNFSYPCMCEGEPAEYTEVFKNMELIEKLNRKISTLHVTGILKTRVMD